MLKYIILLWLLSTTLLAKSQSQKSLFKTLTIGFQYGDEAMSYEEIHFKIVRGKVTASISYPNTDKVLLSNVELNLSQTKTIDSFLNLAEKYKTACAEKTVSSYVQYYTIIKDNDTTKISRFCDWQNLTFPNIKHLIFKTHLKALEVAKGFKISEYFKILKGKWKESTPLDKLSLTSICNLTKVAQDAAISEYVEFISSTKLVLHRKKGNLYYNYHFDFNNENTYIQLDPYQNPTEFIYGHSFLMIVSDSNTMKLTRGFP